MKPVVLFLCTGNSARTQMAEAILRHEAGDCFEIYSAGANPRGINPFAEQVITEVGISMKGQWSKSVEEYVGRLQVNYLIVVCRDREQVFPSLWPGIMSRIYWPFEDPAAVTGEDGKKTQFFRIIRDQIWDRLNRWLHQQGVKRRD